MRPAGTHRASQVADRRNNGFGKFAQNKKAKKRISRDTIAVGYINIRTINGKFRNSAEKPADCGASVVRTARNAAANNVVASRYRPKASISAKPSSTSPTQIQNISANWFETSNERK